MQMSLDFTVNTQRKGCKVINVNCKTSLSSLSLSATMLTIADRRLCMLEMRYTFAPMMLSLHLHKILNIPAIQSVGLKVK